jgi:hypothetical protein
LQWHFLGRNDSCSIGVGLFESLGSGGGTNEAVSEPLNISLEYLVAISLYLL